MLMLSRFIIMLKIHISDISEIVTNILVLTYVTFETEF